MSIDACTIVNLCSRLKSNSSSVLCPSLLLGIPNKPVIVMVSKEDSTGKRKFHNSQEKDFCARVWRYWLHSGIVKFHLKFSIYALARRTDR